MAGITGTVLISVGHASHGVLDTCEQQRSDLFNEVPGLQSTVEHRSNRMDSWDYCAECQCS